MVIAALLLAAVAVGSQVIAATPAPNADLVECRFAKAGSLALADADAVAIFFPRGLNPGENLDAEVIDSAFVLMGEAPRRVDPQVDGIALVASSGRMRPFIVLRHDATHQGDDYAAAMDFVASEGDALARVGFCIRVRGQQAIDRRGRILAGVNFGARQ